MVGVFLSADEVQGNPRGMNPYAYVGDNPETLSDPSGERFISPSGGQEGPQGPITTGGSSSSSQPATGVEQQAISYQNLLNPGAASNGLPLLLNAFLNDHQSWVMAESYAQNQLHTSLIYLLGMEAWYLVHDAGINWNATTTLMHLFLRLNGVAMAYAMASTGTGLEGGGITDAQALVSDSETMLANEADVGACGGGLSFTATTLVATAHGKQAIGTMKVGEQVWAYNPRTKKMELKPVLRVWINHDTDLVDLTLTITTAAKHGKAALKTSETIHTNKKHPFLTKEKGFLPVGQITIGMHVLRADGTYGTVTGWKLVPGIRVMYNLEVVQDHTFTVGVGQWVVHNCGETGSSDVNNPETDSQTPGDYWRQSSLNNAPRQTTPGTKELNGVHVNDLGQEEPWTAYYDDYGRIAARTDYTRGNQAAGIPPVHYHLFKWNEQYPLGRELPDHFPGEYVP